MIKTLSRHPLRAACRSSNFEINALVFIKTTWRRNGNFGEQVYCNGYLALVSNLSWGHNNFKVKDMVLIYQKH